MSLKKLVLLRQITLFSVLSDIQLFYTRQQLLSKLEVFVARCQLCVEILPLPWLQDPAKYYETQHKVICQLLIKDSTALSEFQECVDRATKLWLYEENKQDNKISMEIGKKI